jgi:hypothetical protein
MGGLWLRIKRFSIWRVPNYFLEPTGAFLGERVEAIDSLNKARSWIAIAIIVVTAMYYGGLSHLGTITKGNNGTRQLNIGVHSTEGHWLAGFMLSVILAMFLLPTVSLIIVLWTRPGSRRNTREFSGLGVPGLLRSS